MDAPIIWTKPLLKQFVKAYAKAVAKGNETFVFEAQTFGVKYAEYLIEYLTPRLKK